MIKGTKVSSSLIVLETSVVTMAEGQWSREERVRRDRLKVEERMIRAPTLDWKPAVNVRDQTGMPKAVKERLYLAGNSL